MRRWIAVPWHASFFVIGAVLYFFFVLPRWLELTDAWPVGLGLTMRILCGAIIGLAALPVVLVLLRTRKPEFGTPQLALSLRFWSTVLHVLAGALIIGAAISEIWVSLDAAGQTLFGIYGAAAAIAIVGALAFYLAYAAELPPPPPKPLKLKSQGRRRGRGASVDDEPGDDDAKDDVTDEVVDQSEPSDTPDEVKDVPTPVTLEKDDEVAEATEATEATEAIDTPETTETPATDVPSSNGAGNAREPDADEPDSKLRNRRPNGKSTSRLFGRSPRGVALDD
jgi:hypothetical protein